MDMKHAPKAQLGSWHGLTNYGTFLILLLVLIAPSNILGLAFGFFLAGTSGKGSLRYLPLTLSASLFVASYNSTKISESDLYFYERASEALSNASFGQLLLLYGHEPGYYFFNWVYVHVFGFDWTSWVFVFSFFLYFLWLSGLRILHSALDLDQASKLAILVWAAFFPLVFVQSGHLVRQYIATSISLFAMATFLMNGRGWLYFSVAPLFHATAIVFLVVPISSWLSQRSRRAAILFTVIGPLLLLLGGRELGQNVALLEGLGLPSVVTYGIGRLSQEQFYELNDVSSIVVVSSLISLGLAFFGLALGLPKSISPSRRVSSRFAAFVAFNMVLAASVLVLDRIELPEPSTRLFQFVILQFPFMLSLYLQVFPRLRIFAIAMGVLMPFAFFLYPTTWTYGDPIEILFLPYYVYLLGG